MHRENNLFAFQSLDIDGHALVRITRNRRKIRRREGDREAHFIVRRQNYVEKETSRFDNF